MTRPRSAQLNNPQTRYTKIPLPSTPTAGSSSTFITGSNYTNFINASSTQTVGGIQTPTVATLIASQSNPDPYNLSNPTTIQITIPTVNGGLPVSVTFNNYFNALPGPNQISGSRVAEFINNAFAAYGVTVPVAERYITGQLVLRAADSSGYIAGPSSSITLSGAAPVLNVLGFGFVTSITANGNDIARGVLTATNDPSPWGGDIYFTRSDGFDLTASSNNFYRLPFLNQSDDSETLFAQDVVPGSKVFGKIALPAPSTIQIRAWSKYLRSIPAITQYSDFGSITAPDTFDVTLYEFTTNTQYTMTADFSTATLPFTSVLALADHINTQWHFETGNRQARAISKVVAPFYVNGSFDVRIDNNAPITITLTDDLRSATDVASAIQAALTAAASTGTAFANDGRVYIESATLTDSDPLGAVSSVELIIDNAGVARALGMSSGKFIGYNLCQPNGAELLFSVPFASFAFKFDAVSTTAFGLSTSPVTGVLPKSAQEVRIPFPFLPNNNVSTFTNQDASDYIIALIPEMEEMGDVPKDQFYEERSADATVNTKLYEVTNTKGWFNSGATVQKNDTGTILPSTVPYKITSATIGGLQIPDPVPFGTPNSLDYVWPYAYSEYYFAPQQTIIEVAQNTRPVPSIYPATYYPNQRIGVAGYPSITSPGLQISSNLKGRPFTSSHGSNSYESDVNAAPSSALTVFPESVTIQFQNPTALEWDATTWSNSYEFRLENGGYGASINSTFSLATDSAISTLTGSLKLSDENLRGTIPQVYGLSSSVLGAGDQVLRIGDRNIVNGTSTPGVDPYSIFRHLNGRSEITVGDGSFSFGDFSGPDALQAAFAYINSSGVPYPKIFVKRGIYVSTDVLSISTGNGVLIEAVEPDNSVYIAAPSDATKNTISVSGGTELTLKGIRVLSNVGLSGVLATNSTVRFEKCDISGFKYSSSSNLFSATSVYASNTTFRPGGPQSAMLDVSFSQYNTSGSDSYIKPLIFQSCLFEAGNQSDKRCLFVTGPSGSTAVTDSYYLSSISFSDCVFNLGYYSTVSSGATSVNTGLIELNPQNDGSLYRGLAIKSVSYDRCIVNALNSNSNCLIQLHSNLTNVIYPAPGSSNFGQIDSLSLRDCSLNVRAHNNSGGISQLCIGDGAKSCTIDNVTVNYLNNTNSSLYGIWPNWLDRGTLGNFGECDCNLTFACTNLTVKNFKVENALVMSNPTSSNVAGADVGFIYGNNLSIDGFYVSYDENALNASFPNSPRHRIIIWRYNISPLATAVDTILFTSTASVRNMNLTGTSAANPFDFAEESVVFNLANQISYYNCSVRNFSSNPNTYPISAFLVKSTTDFPNFISRVSFHDCVINGIQRGISYIDYSSGYSQSSTVSNCNITTREYAPGSSNGIRVYDQGMTTNGKFTFRDNFIEIDAGVYSGATPATTADVSCGILACATVGTYINVPGLTFNISGNTITSTDNDPGPGVVQAPCVVIAPYPMGAAREQPSSFYMNDLSTLVDGTDLDDTGIVTVMRWTGTAYAVVTSPQTVSGPAPISVHRGLETAYDPSIPSFGGYGYTDTQNMVHNRGVLHNRNNPT